MNAAQVAAQHAFAEASRERPLRELVDEILAILSQIDEAEGEVTGGQDAALDALNLSIEQKVEAYAAAHQRLQAEAEALKDLATYYREKQRTVENNAEGLRARLHLEMQRLGRDKIKTPTASATIQQNPAKLQITATGTDTEIIDAYKVSSDFVIIERKLDRKALLERLRAGEVLPFAKIERGNHLRLR